MHLVLTGTTYIGRHRFNSRLWKTREKKPEAEVVEMTVPPIVDAAEFEAMQTLLKARSPALTAPRVVSGATPPYRNLLLRDLRLCRKFSEAGAWLIIAGNKFGEAANDRVQRQPFRT